MFADVYIEDIGNVGQIVAFPVILLSLFLDVYWLCCYTLQTGIYYPTAGLLGEACCFGLDRDRVGSDELQVFFGKNNNTGHTLEYTDRFNIPETKINLSDLTTAEEEGVKNLTSQLLPSNVPETL
ncbi:hypothetical protein Q8A67_019613 [Cirrhinus molitorella]|uniref:Uncharacterized protein n=1 Tax=Cirrhinus molitorella TaxID=172907 RepID=A0AA88PE84_9TELE|nr:hypothetical protein Q8A67_019613 [Cirrhinus molitorella]